MMLSIAQILKKVRKRNRRLNLLGEKKNFLKDNEFTKLSDIHLPTENLASQ